MQIAWLPRFRASMSGRVFGPDLPADEDRPETGKARDERRQHRDHDRQAHLGILVAAADHHQERPASVDDGPVHVLDRGAVRDAEEGRDDCEVGVRSPPGRRSARPISELTAITREKDPRIHRASAPGHAAERPRVPGEQARSGW